MIVTIIPSATKFESAEVGKFERLQGKSLRALDLSRVQAYLMICLTMKSIGDIYNYITSISGAHSSY